MDLTLRRRNGSPLVRLPDEMSDLFGRFLGDRDPSWGNEALWPLLNIAEDEKTFMVKAEVPGCKPEDIEISVTGNTMTITGEKKEKAEEKKENYYHVESRYGSFRRTLTLPNEVDSDKVDAKCEDGILVIILPKSEKAVAKRIKVST